MKSDYKEKMDEIDKLIRKGQGDDAKARLHALLKSQPSRRHLIQLAALSRRLSLPIHGLRLLNTVLHPQKRAHTNPSPLEIIEYANCLSILGAHQKAIQLLDQVSSKEYPQSLIAKVYALVAEWDYEATIPILKTYLIASGLSSYEVLIGEANLLAAYVYERRFNDAAPLLLALKEKTHKTFPFLYAKVLELEAQIAFLKKDWVMAEQKLDEAEKHFSTDMGLDSFFIKKWRILLTLMHKPKNEESLLLLNKLRMEAIQWKHWGTLRQCDYYEAIATANKELLLKVYFGTTYPSIKKYLLKDWGVPVEMPTVYPWKLGNTAGNQSKINLFLESESAPYSGLKEGQAPHRLLFCLSQDFYSPQAATSIHSCLFPNEYFNPYSTPVKIHQLVKRTRQVLKKNNSPLQILEEAGSYYLNSTVSCELLIPLNKITLDRVSHQTNFLRASFGESNFTAVEAANVLKASSSNALKLIQLLINRGVIEREGIRRNAKYQFVLQFKKTG